MTGDIRNFNNEQKQINSALPLIKLCDTYKNKAIFGIISKINDVIIDNSGNKLIKFEDDALSFISDLGLVDYDKTIVRVNTAGDGIVKIVFRENEDIEAGDYITSYRKGYGIKQEDDLNHNYTIAKATEDLKYIDATGEITIDDIVYKTAELGVIYLN